MVPTASARALRHGLETKLTYESQRAYVAFMFDVLGRLLAAGSQADRAVQRELNTFPEGYCVAFAVLGERLGVRIVRRGERFVVEPPSERRPDLQIIFKHVTHAFALLSFRESTPRAFANGRMVTDGDVALTMRFVRCLDRVQGVMLPNFIAARALKSLPRLRRLERLRLTVAMTREIVASYFRSIP
jgi:hypothetical protein